MMWAGKPLKTAVLVINFGSVCAKVVLTRSLAEASGGMIARDFAGIPAPSELICSRIV
ncbi:MAG: hypothetical protein UY33_C0003G0029 [Candidatus Amesbacteria bacterium GW2011_GWA1_48_9]|uniref:Uncharacterized protein n=1 Tax=Candidatus Amesbacteria bacterium GW2011_GWA1_48_9 TaxID=1618355 RepID=A0A0G1V3C2_9BACT|nr:MAG: hypothetical protein UY33_C0003G0029 [Candidatus Amesbacteria bacterium GW2011_GWA1_48_9]